MLRVMEELRQHLLRMAHFNNAKPVSDHHPGNMTVRQIANELSFRTRVKLDETGVYDGKVEPQCGQLFANSHSK